MSVTSARLINSQPGLVVLPKAATDDPSTRKKAKPINLICDCRSASSFTQDGQVHYYVSPGVDDLTEADYVTSQFPYGYKCDRLNNFFFNVANHEDGRTWSTEFVIDDPSLYFIRRETATAPPNPTRKPRVITFE